jgi:23S rRNA pseudouridine1911/1915/1917 synthase
MNGKKRNGAYEMERKRIEVLEQNGDWAVCLKPVGVESEKEMPELLSAMLGGMFFPVHRLDLNVGGLTVYARNGEAAARLSELIRTGSFRKAYMALVHGNPPASGRMDDLLWKDARAKKVYVVQRMRRGVKKAALSYETLWTDTKKDRSLVLVRLETGRTHQIRVQFSSRGMPLAGDKKYGSRFRDWPLALWAASLSFPHPVTGETICRELPPPEELPWTLFDCVPQAVLRPGDLSDIISVKSEGR